MEITRDELEWTTDDQLNFQTFLSSQTGSRLIPKWAESAPTLLHKGDTNEILIKNGELLGFQEAIRSLLFLVSPTPTLITPVTHYPDLDDERAWNDGQNLKK